MRVETVNNASFFSLPLFSRGKPPPGSKCVSLRFCSASALAGSIMLTRKSRRSHLQSCDNTFSGHDASLPFEVTANVLED